MQAFVECHVQALRDDFFFKLNGNLGIIPKLN